MIQNFVLLHYQLVGGGHREAKILCDRSVIIDDTQGFDGVRYYNEYSPTLRANRSGLKTIQDYRIRKLTPKEYWRLQAFSDEDFDKCVNIGTSNSQLYKQAGNSITVTVIEEIFKNLFLNIDKTQTPSK